MTSSFSKYFHSKLSRKTSVFVSLWFEERFLHELKWTVGLTAEVKMRLRAGPNYSIDHVLFVEKDKKKL